MRAKAHSVLAHNESKQLGMNAQSISYVTQNHQRITNLDLIAMQIKTGGGAVVDERLVEAHRKFKQGLLPQ